MPHFALMTVDNIFSRISPTSSLHYTYVLAWDFSDQQIGNQVLAFDMKLHHLFSSFGIKFQCFKFQHLEILQHLESSFNIWNQTLAFGIKLLHLEPIFSIWYQASAFEIKLQLLESSMWITLAKFTTLVMKFINSKFFQLTLTQFALMTE